MAKKEEKACTKDVCLCKEQAEKLDNIEKAVVALAEAYFTDKHVSSFPPQYVAKAIQLQQSVDKAKTEANK